MRRATWAVLWLISVAWVGYCAYGVGYSSKRFDRCWGQMR